MPGVHGRALAYLLHAGVALGTLGCALAPCQLALAVLLALAIAGAPPAGLGEGLLGDTTRGRGGSHLPALCGWLRPCMQAACRGRLRCGHRPARKCEVAGQAMRVSEAGR